MLQNLEFKGMEQEAYNKLLEIVNNFEAKTDWNESYAVTIDDGELFKNNSVSFSFKRVNCSYNTKLDEEATRYINLLEFSNLKKGHIITRLGELKYLERLKIAKSIKESLNANINSSTKYRWDRLELRINLLFHFLGILKSNFRGGVSFKELKHLSRLFPLMKFEVVILPYENNAPIPLCFKENRIARVGSNSEELLPYCEETARLYPKIKIWHPISFL